MQLFFYLKTLHFQQKFTVKTKSGINHQVKKTITNIFNNYSVNIKNHELLLNGS